MRLARKVFLLVTMGIAALAMTASSSNAAVVITQEELLSTHQCPALVVNTPHNITGGCHVEFESTEEVELVAHIPDPIIVSNCEVHFGARIATNGEGYVIAATLTTHPAPSNPCTRRPCQEINQVPHEMIPWPIHIRAFVSNESLEVRFCFEPLSSQEGQNQGNCTVHLELTNLGNHNYEIGHPEPNPSHEAFCEESSPFQISIRRAHFIYEAGTEERIEITHS